MSQFIKINDRYIGSGYPTYIIAEMSANHNQNFDRAVRIVEEAAKAGADAIKLQTYTPDTLTIDCDNEHFQINEGLWEGRTLYDLYNEAYMPWEWQPKLQQVASDLGLDFFSTAYDETAVEFLEELDIPVYKVASFELVDLPLLKKIAQTGKPLIVSTGMATLAEIDEAVRNIRETGGDQLALLKCTSAYPAPPEEMNLLTIPNLADTFSVPIGLSDHTLGTTVPVAAVSLGACLVEKHFTLSGDVSGPDSSFSLSPLEFKRMVEALRKTEKALGSVQYSIEPQESKSELFRKSLFVTDSINAGEIFTTKNVRSIRPGYGLHPRYFGEILGRRAVRKINPGTPLSWSLIGNFD